MAFENESLFYSDLCVCVYKTQIKILWFTIAFIQRQIWQLTLCVCVCVQGICPLGFPTRAPGTSRTSARPCASAEVPWSSQSCWPWWTVRWPSGTSRRAETKTPLGRSRYPASFPCSPRSYTFDQNSRCQIDNPKGVSVKAENNSGTMCTIY